MDCSPPGSSVHGIFQARILEWAAVSFSRGSSWPMAGTRISCIAGRLFTVWATGEAPICFINSLKRKRWITLEWMFPPRCQCREGLRKNIFMWWGRGERLGNLWIFSNIKLSYIEEKRRKLPQKTSLSSMSRQKSSRGRSSYEKLTNYMWIINCS